MFECVQICTVSDTLPAVPIARRGLSGIECRPVQRVQRPGVYAVPCMVCPASGTACPAACAVQSVRVRWGLGLHRRGIQRAPVVGWSTPRVEKIQKRRSFHTHPLFSAQNTPTPIANLKNSAQKQKDPYKGSVFCAILALQALNLKGRNLQWLKVK